MASLDTQPEYPGGMNEFFKWVSMNYKMPEAARKAAISGRLVTQFVVEKDGSLKDIKMVKDLGYKTAETAIKLLATSKPWKPGIKNGKPVRVQYTLPLSIKTGKEKSSTDTIIIFRSWKTH
jgi:protein TonB